MTNAYYLTGKALLAGGKLKFIEDVLTKGTGFYYTKYNDNSNGSGPSPSYGYNSSKGISSNTTECKPI